MTSLNISTPRPMARFFAALGWESPVRDHPDFPLREFTLAIDPRDNKVYVGWIDKRTGEIGALADDVADFPSPTLVASFRLLVGPIDEIMAQYNKILNRRTRRNLRR